MRKLLIIILLLVTALSMAAQTDTLRLGYSASGTVVDAYTGKPLESVHVSIPGRHQATVTNADGYFTLKSDRSIPVIEFSYLGFKTLRQQPGESMTVRLQRENLQLLEASIISGDPQSIVKAALDRTWDTYCTEPELLECFYRETVRKRNRYTYVAEAVARVYKHTFDGTTYRDAAALEKSRLLVSQRKSDTLSVKTMGGPTQAITHDIVKNPSILFSEDDWPLYEFRMESPSYIGDRLQFVITLTPAYATEYALFKSKLYIDRELLTFTRIEASLDMSDRNKAIRAILVSKPMGLRFFPEEASIVLNYHLQDGKTRLEYFRSTMRFACDWRKRLFRTHYTSVNELVVTDVRPEATPIPRRERFTQRDYLNDKALEFMDPDFWKDYNIIEPTESLEHAINRLRKGR